MSVLFGIVIAAMLAAIVVAGVVLFIVVSLARASHLIAARTGRVPVEAFVVTHPKRRRRPMRVVRRGFAPLTAYSRNVLKHAFRSV
jgi:hypothetical protein